MGVVAVSAEVSLAYDTFGDPAEPAVLLVMGFGAQLIAWHEEFCQLLAEQGRYVIRYDNRDSGLSTRFDDHPVDLARFIAAVSSGDVVAAQGMAPYSLTDMADDGLGLLTALGIERAHIVGASMGGMIAQTMAVTHPERCITLTSMMSSTGEPEYGRSGRRPNRCCSPRGRPTGPGTSPRRTGTSCGPHVATATRRRSVSSPPGATTGHRTRPGSAVSSRRWSSTARGRRRSRPCACRRS